jgi:hypothetical protein
MGDQSTSDASELFIARIQNSCTGEAGLFSLALFQKNSVQMNGYAIPRDVTGVAEFDPSRLEQWENHAEAIPLTLANLFSESRNAFTDLFIRKIDTDIILHYSTWIKRHQPILESLTVLNSKLPSHLHGPVQYLLTNRWNMVIATIEQGNFTEESFVQLRIIWNRAKKYGIKLDFSGTIPVLYSLLLKEMEHFSKAFGTKSNERIRYLLTIVDRFGIPLPKNRLEDNFYRIFNTSIKQLYTEYIENKHPDPEQKTLLVQLLTFARRLNFSTAAYSIT